MPYKVAARIASTVFDIEISTIQLTLSPDSTTAPK
jgi:hypothetical protein